MEFTSWDMYGRKHTVNMKEGELWYLDIRKPHTAINNGEQTRIHLVVDVEANDSAEDYLHVVRDWYDPYDDPIVELHDNVHVVRDDVLPAGSKMRFIDKLIRDTDCENGCLVDRIKSVGDQSR